MKDTLLFIMMKVMTFLEVGKLNSDFLHVCSLPEDMQLNDVRLDKEEFGDGVAVEFIKSGKKLLLIKKTN